MHSFAPESYEFILLILGVVVLLAAWLPQMLAGRALAFPIFYVIAGALLFALPIDLLPSIGPQQHGEVTERLTELAVIVALMGAGLKLDRKFSWRGWAATWRLLAIAMPLTIFGVAMLGWWAVGLAPATAMLLGAVIAPTDPVLASDVQVHGPGEGGEDAVRFALTSEAGLNDGLAFPFTNMAIAMAVVGASPAGWWADWLLIDLVYKIAIGCVGGLAVGWVLGWLLFRSPSRGSDPLAQSMQGSLALAATLLAYGLVELASGYGFIAVFVAACVMRQTVRDHEYHQALHHFVEDMEHWLTAVLLVLLGGASLDLLEYLSWRGLGVAVAIVLLVRPVSGVIALLGRHEPWRERGTIGFFGIRGIGSLYYLSYALNEAEFEQARELWAIVVATVLISIAIHGLSAAPVMRYLDARRDRQDRRPDRDRPAVGLRSVSRVTAITLAGVLCCACEGGLHKPLEHDAPPVPSAPPAWFDAAKIPHEAVIMHMAPEPTVYASTMILELESGVTKQQCIERAMAALGDSLSELPEVIPAGRKHLMLQGATDVYSYTIMCTEAEGEPTTMHLSYSDRDAERDRTNRWSRPGG